MPQLLVIGSAPCMEADVSRLDLAAFDVAAVNRAGCRYAGRIEWWVTLHPLLFRRAGWMRQRRDIYGNDDFALVMPEPHSGAQRQAARSVLFPAPRVSGSSTLLAVLFGLAQGYERVVVAGAPLEGEYAKFQAGWEHARKHLAGRVTSVSGWTKSFLESL